MASAFMKIHQIIFMGIMAAGFIGACIKAPRRVIGGVIGGVMGALIPFLLSEIYVWRGGDPTAAGAFSFLCLFTVPLGILVGVGIASSMVKRNVASEKSNVEKDEDERRV